MSSHFKEVNGLGTLAEHQEELSKLGERLETIKKKYLSDKSLDLLDYKFFLKEAERLETDVKFMRSLLDDLKDLDSSLTSKFFRKVLPGKSVSQGRDVSKEFKASVMAFSTKFFEDKVKYLESSLKKSRKHKKKSHQKKTSQEVCSSVTHSPSEESTIFKKNNSEDKTKATDISKQSSILFKPIEKGSPCVSLQCVKENEAEEYDFTAYNKEKRVDKEITRSPQLSDLEIKINQANLEIKNNPARDFTPCLSFSPSYVAIEKSVQTDVFNFVPKISCSNSCEKCVQTEIFNQFHIMNEILEALKKVGEVYSVPSDRSPLYNAEDVLSLSSAASSPSDLLLWRSSEPAEMVESIADLSLETALNSPVSRISYDGMTEHFKKNPVFEEDLLNSKAEISKLREELKENVSICKESGYIPSGFSNEKKALNYLVEGTTYENVSSVEVELSADLDRKDMDVNVNNVFDFKTNDGRMKIARTISKTENVVSRSSELVVPPRIISSLAGRRPTLIAVNSDSGDEGVAGPSDRSMVWIPLEPRKGHWSKSKECTSLLYPFVYYCKETEGQSEDRESLPEDGINAFQGLSLQLSRHQTAEESTLQIVYHHSPNKKGKITLTEFGQSGTTTQSEIVGRIISYLIGLPPPNDKT